MKHIIRHLLSGVLLLTYANSSSQNNSQIIDSLKQLSNNANHDSIKINALKAWDDLIYISDPELDLEINKKINDICNLNLKKDLTEKEKTFFLTNNGSAINIIGINYFQKSDYFKALKYYLHGLKIRESLGDKVAIAGSYNNIGIIYQYQGDYDRALSYYLKSLKIAEELDDKPGISRCVINIGTIYHDKGEYDKALKAFFRSHAIDKELKSEEGMATSLNHIGRIYNLKGDYVKALSYYTNSLRISEKLGDQKNISFSYGNIGEIHVAQGNFEKGIFYFNKALEISTKIEDKLRIASYLNSIGETYFNMEKVDTALNYFSKGLEIRKSINSKLDVTSSLFNIGKVYTQKKDFSKALNFMFEAQQIQEELGAKNSLASTLFEIGDIYRQMGDYEKAKVFGTKALEISKKMGAVTIIRDASLSLYKTHRHSNKYQNALEMYELYVEMKDSIINQENQKQLLKEEYKYEYQKKATADSVKNAEADKVKDAILAAQRAENKQQKLQSYFLFGGLGLTLFLGAFIFSRFRIAKKQKEIIQLQKTQVDYTLSQLEEKNKKIVDSINYAKRIQSAILPPMKIVKEFLPNSFVLYKPKDIVAGDFYWLQYRKDKIFFAVADCTGHGVPGAMVSVICNNGLNRSVREHHLTDPGQILDQTREIVIQEFEKSEEEVKDGMDIALCTLENNKLEYAGANNPLWIFRNGELISINANKEPIGKFDNKNPYTTHLIELQKDDTIYIFSDGFSDQFGGPKGKKLKSKAFKEILMSVQNESMDTQSKLIDEAFEKWKGDLEQIDDVCIIGVRI